MNQIALFFSDNYYITVADNKDIYATQSTVLRYFDIYLHFSLDALTSFSLYLIFLLPILRSFYIPYFHNYMQFYNVKTVSVILNKTILFYLLMSSSILKALPMPTPDSALQTPLCWLTICFTIASPSPETLLTLR